MVQDVLATERIVCVDDVLSGDECETVLDELGWTWWHESTTWVPGRDDSIRATHAGIGYVSRARRSATAHQYWFSDHLHRVLVELEGRVREATGLDPMHFEPWQATRYGSGGRFAVHHDSSGKWHDLPGGDRATTVMVYLDEPSAGGATAFPLLDLTVAPRPGRLLVWHNLLGDGSVDPAMNHAGLPVEAGTKTTLITWARERPYRRTGAPTP